MMENMRRIEIVIFVLSIFIGMAFVPCSGMSEGNVMEKWVKDHSLKVNATTTCKYEGGYLEIKEVYTGEELKERFGIEQFTKELKIPVEGEVLGEGKLRGMQEGEEKVFVTEKVTVLTSGDDPPQWWDNYTYPQRVWFKSGEVYEKGLPINLAWKNTTKNTAKSEILEEGWVDSPIQYTEYVYDPIDGWIIGDGVATSTFGIFGRYHANLWQMSDGNVVANAHHDSAVPHEADKLEEAEELVAGFFNESEDIEWNVYEDSYNLDNNVTSPYSDGWCSQISYGSATWYVPDDYLKIQWVVSNATAGDTIIVRDGTYSENVDVNVDNLTIRSENGSANCIVQAANPNDHVLEVTADYVHISGFTMRGAQGHLAAGICLFNPGYCNISSNDASNNYCGIWLFVSNNNTIINNNASNNTGIGIYLQDSSNSTVITNNARSNNFGIAMYSSCNGNTVIRNNATSNNYNGIRILNSSGNFVYLNNFVSNSGWGNVFSENSTNTWNSSEKITYTYNGSTHINYVGNYWDDYKEKYPDAEEIDGSGIWNTPYSMDSENDPYPLMELWENYFTSAENIFDTEAPANPYPSIFGIHNGTIKLNQTITVNRLYTYPCVGTGGHTEFAMLWNKTIGECAVAEWSGYIGDYHNISFNKTLTLKEGVIYNYTIHTGSYPQIIHESPFNATAGTITCDKFIDANGRLYYDWIPAIKLWAG